MFFFFVVVGPVTKGGSFLLPPLTSPFVSNPACSSSADVQPAAADGKLDRATPDSIARVSSVALGDSAVACLPGAPIRLRSAGVADLGGLAGLGSWQRRRAKGARSTSARSRTSPTLCRRPWPWLLLSQLLLAAVLAGFLSQAGHRGEGAGAACKGPRRRVEARDIFGAPRVSWDSLRRVGWMPSTIGGEEVELLNDSHYKEIRAMCDVKITDLAQNLFSFDRLEKGGGKGSMLTRDPARVSPIWPGHAWHPDTSRCGSSACG